MTEPTDRDRQRAREAIHRWGFDELPIIEVRLQMPLAQLIAAVRAEAHKETIKECAAKAIAESDKNVAASKTYFDERSRSACLSDALALRKFAVVLCALRSRNEC
jgi:hypothetical protein